MASLAPLCTLVALLLSAPAPAPDAPPSAPQEQNEVPLGPEALPELLALATNAKAPEPQRVRAISTLAVVAHPEAPQRLRDFARDPALPVPLRAAAMEALGRRAGVAALPSLTPLLADPNEAVRAAAAQTLGRVGGPDARRALEERLAHEESLSVRDALQQALSYLEP